MEWTYILTSLLLIIAAAIFALLTFIRWRRPEPPQNAHDDLEKETEKQIIKLLVMDEELRREKALRKPVEETLLNSLKLITRANQEWESTVNSLPQLIFLIDGQGLILRTNRTVERWHLASVVNTQ